MIVFRARPAEVFDAIEKSLNEIVGVVNMRIKRARVLTVGARWHHRLGATSVDGIDQDPRIVGFVSDHFPDLEASRQGLGRSMIQL